MTEFKVKCFVKYGVTETNSDFLILSFQELNSLLFFFFSSSAFLFFCTKDHFRFHFSFYLNSYQIPSTEILLLWIQSLQGLASFIPVTPHSAKERASLARSDMNMMRGHCLARPVSNAQKGNLSISNFVLLKRILILGLSTLCKCSLGNGHIAIQTDV